MPILPVFLLMSKINLCPDPYVKHVLEGEKKTNESLVHTKLRVNLLPMRYCMAPHLLFMVRW